jgi:hypothetical protein
LKDSIYMAVWHLDVGLLRPETKGGFKGSAVRRLKVVHELGSERCETVRPLSSTVKIIKSKVLVREDQRILVNGILIVLSIVV